PTVTPTAAAIAAAGAAAAVPIGLARAANPGTAQATAPAAADPDLAPATLAPPLLGANRIAPRAISPQNAWLMDDMMADVIKRGTGVRALVLKRNDIAGKTGTSNDQRDAWFNGFNRHMVATVWVGFDDGQPLGEAEQGSLAAVPIWVSFMREALRGQPDLARPLPPGLVTERISKRTGLLAGPDDPDAMYETFMADHLPPAANTGITVPGTTQTPDGGGTPLF
ncbi:MAG: penicillin-binding transpeptidase domain-containing protein, partial [Steroidobacteraceae bacterium]